MTYREYYEQGEKKYRNCEYEEALDYFQKALNLNRSNDCLNYIGCCYLNLSDYKSARELFFKLSEENPDWERPVFNLGRVFLKSGYKEEALIAFKEAEKRNSNNEDVYFYLGVYYDELQDYLMAKKYYEKSILINEEQPETHLNLGICYFHLGMNEKAIQEFDSALYYSKDCLDAIYNKGKALISMGKYSKALEEFLFINKKCPTDIEVMLKIAEVHYKTFNYESSLIWINQIFDIDPKHFKANRLLKFVKRDMMSQG